MRLETAPPLPDGWCGKQHACFALSKLARYDVLTFLDADVRLAPDALARMAAFLRAVGAALVSGFPRQETGTLLEKLLIPLIHLLLLCFLPLWAMRQFRWSGVRRRLRAVVHDDARRLREGRRARGGEGVAARRPDAAAGLPQGRVHHRPLRRDGPGDVPDVPLGVARCGTGWRRTPARGWRRPGRSGSGRWCCSCGQVLPFVLLVLAVCSGRCRRSRRDRRRSLASRHACDSRSRVRRFRQSLARGAASPGRRFCCCSRSSGTRSFRAVIGKPVGWKGRAAPEPSGSRRRRSVAACDVTRPALRRRLVRLLHDELVPRLRVLAEQLHERRRPPPGSSRSPPSAACAFAGRASSAASTFASISPRPLNRVISGFAFARSPARISSLCSSSRAQCVSLPTSMRYSGGWAM